MGPVPRRGTHAPVRAPHGEHAARARRAVTGLVTRPIAAGHSLAPALAQNTARGAPIGSRLEIRIEPSRPAHPSTPPNHSSGRKDREDVDARLSPTPTLPLQGRSEAALAPAPRRRHPPAR